MIAADARTRCWPGRIRRTIAVLALTLVCATSGRASAQTAEVPTLTGVVNDFARVVDATSASSIERVARSLQAASGDVIVVATVPTIEPFGDIREYAVKLFQNGGAGIGEKGKDNGVLVLLALKERRVWVEVGYGNEPYITDGFAGQVSRDVMTPEFRNGNYGAGLLAGAVVMAQRIAQGKNVQLTDVPQVRVRRARGEPRSANWVLLVFVLLIVASRFFGGGPRSGMRRYGRGSVWSSGVGPFGGGFGGGGFGGGGGGFGGGFGGFGGGRSGGGGGGSSW